MAARGYVLEIHFLVMRVNHDYLVHSELVTRDRFISMAGKILNF